MNSFEIAILRILIKRNNNPIPTHNLIEGFPDGTENKVVLALKNLRQSGFIYILPGSPIIEEEYVIYNTAKKDNILKIIDPLIELQEINNFQTNKNIIQNKITQYIKNDKKIPIKPLTVTISILFFLAMSVVSNVIPTVNDDLDNIFLFHGKHHYHNYHEAFGNKAYPYIQIGDHKNLLKYSFYEEGYKGDKFIDHCKRS